MLLLFSLLASAAAERWAVIAAGSDGYWNYRHQADVCHAYRILVDNGVPEDNIILMTADDVAGSSYNPFPGKLYNYPSATVPDVRAGCKAAYTGRVVTKDLFLAVITGDAEKAQRLSGKSDARVLQSTSEDTVYINFADHGGVGLIAFPFGPYLLAEELHGALRTMHEKNLYKQALFYMEACESGSMFINESDLPPNFLALTAANFTSSWATYCPPNDKVHGRHTDTCLGDTFSVKWMEDDDEGKEHSETIEEQFGILSEEVTESQVCAWGDKSLMKETLETFVGAPTSTAFRRPAKKPKATAGDAGAVPSRDVKIHLAYYRWLRAAEGSEERSKLWKEFMNIVQERDTINNLYVNMMERLCDAQINNKDQCRINVRNQYGTTKRFDRKCHQTLHEAFNACKWNENTYQFSKMFANVCEEHKTDTEIYRMKQEVEFICSSPLQQPSRAIFA